MTRSCDTTSAAELVRVAAIRAMSPGMRLRQALDWSESVRRVALAALRQRYPHYTDRAIIELLHGGHQRAIEADQRPL